MTRRLDPQQGYIQAFGSPTRATQVFRLTTGQVFASPTGLHTGIWSRKWAIVQVAILAFRVLRYLSEI